MSFLNIKNEHEENTGAQIHYVEKHVDFTNDINNDDNENRITRQYKQKLHRRDTPHHLKNKRIMNKNSDSVAIDVNILFFFFTLKFCVYLF